MKTKTHAPIVAEVQAVRDEEAAGYGYDVHAIFRDLRARQESSGRKHVRYPARRAQGEEPGSRSNKS
jgi:hypothetical protein